jgi:hypothetical protein
MWFAYMDEAGNTGRNLHDSAQPVHLILTLVVDESRVNDLHEHIRAVGARHCPDVCADPAFEFHGYDLFGGDGPFEGMSPAKRIEIYGDVLDCIRRVDAKVIIRGVYKPGLAARYANPFHPHDVALMFTIESVERLAREHDRRVLLVADEAREIEDGALRDLANYQQMGTTWGWNTEQIDHVVDTIHFVRSETNPAIQLADCAMFIAARQRKIDSGLVIANAAVTDLWTGRIAPHVHGDSIWHPTP